MTVKDLSEKYPIMGLVYYTVRLTFMISVISAFVWYFRTQLPWEDPLDVTKVEEDFHVIAPDGPYLLKFERKVCLEANTTAVIVVQRRYVPLEGQDVTVRAYSDAVYTALPGCEVIAFTVPIPDDLPSGLYEYIPTAVYKRNIFTEDESKTLPTVKFRISD